MKYLPLIWAGLGRKKPRTLFTILSITVAFILFGLLGGVSAAINGALDHASLDRLYIRAKTSMTDPMPIAYLPQLGRIPGVTGVAFSVWFGGYYQDAKNGITSWAVDPISYFDMFPDLKIPRAEVETLAKKRNGVIVGDAIATKYGWKIGDRLPFRSGTWTRRDGTQDWDLEIVGIFTDADNKSAEHQFFINHDYLEESRTSGKGNVSWYYVRVDAPGHATAVAAAIDQQFANSPHETKTMTERQNIESFMKKIGDINFIIQSVMGAVFFTLLFLTGNTMAQSVGERIPELAVLKTLGYSNRGVLALVLAEGVTLTMVAAAAGLGASVILVPLLETNGEQSNHLPPSMVLIGIGCALLLALVAGAPPALRAGRLKVVDALAGR
jgi:putative ABC transport system permease protein